MRIDINEDTPQRLSLSLASSITLYSCFGLLFIALGSWCIRMLALEARIVVEERHLAYSSTCLWIIPCDKVEVAGPDLRGVGLVGQDLQLDLPRGPHRLALPRSNGDEKQQIAREIRAALAQPGSTYRHEEGQPLPALLLGLVCTGSGLLMLLAIQRVKLVADRAAGTLTLTRRLLLWPFRRECAFNLGDIQAARAVMHAPMFGSGHLRLFSVQLQGRGPAGRTACGITFLPMFTEGAADNLAGLLQAWLAAGNRTHRSARASAA